MTSRRTRRFVEMMEVADAFGGPRTPTPTIVIGGEPPHGFEGPVMAPAATAAAAARLWDAIQVISQEPGFFEIAPPAATRAGLTGAARRRARGAVPRSRGSGWPSRARDATILVHAPGASLDVT